MWAGSRQTRPKRDTAATAMAAGPTSSTVTRSAGKGDASQSGSDAKETGRWGDTAYLLATVGRCETVRVGLRVLYTYDFESIAIQI